MGDNQLKTGTARPFLRDALTVLWFAGQMMRKLWKHRHKKHWNASETLQLRDRVDDELRELDTELYCVRVFRYPQDRVAARRNAIRECADAANFLMMIADNMRGQIREKKERLTCP